MPRLFKAGAGSQAGQRNEEARNGIPATKQTQARPHAGRKEGQRQQMYRADILPGIAKRIFFGALDEVSRVWTVSLETNYSLEETINQVLTIFLSGLLSDTKS